MAGNLTAMIAAAFSGGAAPPVTSDPYYEYTTLLLPGNGTNGAQNNTFLDGSTNNFTITRNGNTTQGTFSPFSQTGWGNYFDGSVDSLSVASNAAFAYGTSDFTWEVWVFPTASTWTSGSGNFYIIDHGSSNGTLFYYQNRIAYYNPTTGTGSALYTGGGTVTPNQWSHIAVSRQSGTTRIYVNGQLSTSGSDSNNYAAQAVTIGRAGSGAQEYVGYMSNVRIVKGTAVYTSNFTPPTSPLTAISGTSLLTCQSNRFKDNSTNNFTITVNGSPSVQAFSPFNPSASWSAATYGGSGYFDGSVDYLSVADNAALNIGTADYQISCWVYPTVFNANSNAIVGKGSSNIIFYYDSSGVLSVAQYGVAVIATASQALVLNQWSYITASRVSNVTKIFINSTEVASASDTSNYTSSTALQVGQDPNNASQKITGYLADFRFVKNSGVTSVTVPTAPLTAITNTSLLLNFTNAGIYDATSKNDLETVADAKISTAINNPFGLATGNMYFDGTGDYLLLNQNNTLLNLGTAPFTIEFWFNTTSSTQYANFIGNESGTNGFTIMINVASATAGTVAVFNGASGQIHISTSSYRDGNWHYFALTRDSSGSKMFIDGSQIGSTNTGQASTSFDASSFRWAVASNLQYSGRDFAGYISNLRITKGYARTITASPTAAFPTL